MIFRVIDSDWDYELTEGLKSDCTELRIVCPFIKEGILDILLSPKPDIIKVITRFNLRDFASTVSDVGALRKLVNEGASVRGIRDLHAKLYIFGSSRAIITSANLTNAGLRRNAEFGIVTEKSDVVKNCLDYFENLWVRSKEDLCPERIDMWGKAIEPHLRSDGRFRYSSELPDFGADSGFSKSPYSQIPSGIARAYESSLQAVVKFGGSSKNRAPSTQSVFEEIKAIDGPRTVSFPANKRPTGIRDNAVVFFGRFTDEPDIRVFGHAIAEKYQKGA